MAADADSKVCLVTSDDEVNVVSKETIKLATTIKEMFDNLGEAVAAEEKITLPGVNAAQLKTVVDWIEAHIGKPEYDWSIDEITNERNWAKLSDDDKALLDPLSLADYITLLNAAHYLGVDSLRWAVTQTLAGKVKDMSVEEMREYLNEPDDLTDAEKEAIRREDVWANF